MRVDCAVRGGRCVLLVAHPDDNEHESANCRLALRTVHAACHPQLVEQIPPHPQTRADGSITMLIEPIERRPASTRAQAECARGFCRVWCFCCCWTPPRSRERIDLRSESRFLPHRCVIWEFLKPRELCGPDLELERD